VNSQLAKKKLLDPSVNALTLEVVDENSYAFEAEELR
jgi:hypothetical protein